MTCCQRTDLSGLGGKGKPMNKHALSILEFDRVLERIVERTNTLMGNEYVIQFCFSIKYG